MTVMALQVITAATAIVVGFYIWLQRPKDRRNQLFLIFVSMLSSWLLIGMFSNFDGQFVLIVNKLTFVAALLSAGAGYFFIESVLGASNRLSRWVVYAVMSGISLLTLLTDYVVRGVEARYVDDSFVGYDVIYAEFYHFYIISLVSVAVAGIMLLFKKSIAVKTTKQGRQFRVIGWGLTLTLASGLLMAFILPYALQSSASSEYSFISVLWSVIFFAYAIIWHGLFDVKLVAIRTAAYILSLLTLASIYFSLAYVMSVIFFQGAATAGVSMSPINIGIALLLAFIFQPIKRFFDRATDRIFFRDQYNMDDFIANIGEVSTSTTNLRMILKRSSEVIKGTLKASYATFIVHRDQAKDVVVGYADDPRLLAGELAIIKKEIHKQEPDIITIDSEEDSPISEVAVRHDISLIVPLVGVGYLLLGSQKSGGYKMRDVRALRAVKNELLIAIQNVRSVQEVRDLNRHLQQRIDEATYELKSSNRRLLQLDEVKDEFMSIASHQLRTPLTTIKGYVSMMLDGDLGKVTARQEMVLREVFESSERMVGLISDFLNVSRLRTGKFTIDRVKTDLVSLVDNEVKSLIRSAESRKLTIKTHLPKKPLPDLYLDGDKLRQVIMNFIDNSIYYSKEGGTIDVYVEHKAGQLEFKVVDTGIGVPAKEKDNLFTKFFRATNAHKQRPDGTGVGLFLAKRVIDGHGGDTFFTSKENKGSTFGFRLPVGKLSRPPKA
ncbi:hypothetical protein GX865_01940 [Candidatus Saccharibacteria bacterium]|jgi:signal transduction histidine kinase/phosphotransferase system IIB component|nr:hypothetical protein [Candidatus Saccharibacteria bacterium]